MSEKEEKGIEDNMREGPPLRSMEENARQRNQPRAQDSDKDYSKITHRLLVGGVALIVLAGSAVLYFASPPSAQAAFASRFATSSIIDVEISVLILALSVVFGYLYTRHLKTKKEAELEAAFTKIQVPEERNETGAPKEAAVVEAKPGPQSEHPKAQVEGSQELKGKYAKCKFPGCKRKLEVEKVGWFGLFEHIRFHQLELENKLAQIKPIFEEFPDDQVASDILNDWFSEA